jgi:hypothetical protein
MFPHIENTNSLLDFLTFDWRSFPIANDLLKTPEATAALGATAVLV